jgi:uncharacterized protein with HEPN domain
LSRDERERLTDIEEALAAVRAHLGAAGAWTGDPQLHDALPFQFVVVGEAVKHLAPETRAAASEVPGADVAGLRDLIAHEYFRIDIERVLAIVDRDLPALEQAIDRLLDE